MGGRRWGLGGWRSGSWFEWGGYGGGFNDTKIWVDLFSMIGGIVLVYGDGYDGFSQAGGNVGNAKGGGEILTITLGLKSYSIFTHTRIDYLTSLLFPTPLIPPPSSPYRIHLHPVHEPNSAPSSINIPQFNNLTSPGSLILPLPILQSHSIPTRESRLWKNYSLLRISTTSS